MADATKEMLAVLREALELVRRPGNDFTWSSWDGAEDAGAELRELMRQVEAGAVEEPVLLRVVFAPTGPLQEVSLSSGWSESFMELARRFDGAYGKMQLEPEEE